MPDPKEMEPERDQRFVSLESKLKETCEQLTAKFLYDGLMSQNEAVEQVVGRFEKLIDSALNPVLEDGYIPPTLTCTEAEVVLWFGFNDHRAGLLERIHTWISLSRSVKARRLLLDGSFITTKEEPGDVDAAVLLPKDFRDLLQGGDPDAVELYQMLFTRRPKELFAAEDEEDWWTWVEFFGRANKANRRRKGLIEVML